jgi:hypothetical protein
MVAKERGRRTNFGNFQSKADVRLLEASIVMDDDVELKSREHDRHRSRPDVRREGRVDFSQLRAKEKA